VVSLLGRLQRRLFRDDVAPLPDGVAQSARQFNDGFFDLLGVDPTEVRTRYRELSAQLGLRSDDDESVHRLAFTALQVAGVRPQNVLELGTLHGEATVHLATLFPQATIHTVELPADDPLLRTWHRDSAKRDADTAARFAPHGNIRQIRANSFDLMALDLPLFDLVWLDAGHHYPEVAWDHAYCFGRLRPNGWLFSDDVILPDTAGGRLEGEDFAPYFVLEYVAARKPWPHGRLLKRESAARQRRIPKYIAWFHKVEK
jgi:predicted O-methyltransferase YrrM